MKGGRAVTVVLCIVSMLSCGERPTPPRAARPAGYRIRGVIVSIGSDEIPELTLLTPANADPSGPFIAGATVAVSNCREELRTQTDAHGRFLIELGGPLEGRPCDWILADDEQHYGLQIGKLTAGLGDSAEKETVYLIRLPRLERACPPSGEKGATPPPAQ